MALRVCHLRPPGETVGLGSCEVLEGFLGRKKAVAGATAFEFSARHPP
jgi:hypothetical protein